MVDDILLDEVEAAVVAAAAVLGPRGIDKAAIVNAFLAREDAPSRATLYRYVDKALRGGAPAREAIRQVKAATPKGRRCHPGRAGKRTGKVLEAAVPEIVQVEDVIHGARNVGEVVAQLNSCVEAAQQVMRFARNADGTVRVPRLILNASESLRRSVETLLKLHEAIRNVAEVDRFIQEVIETVEAIARTHPGAAEEILTRTRAMTARWAGGS